MPIERQEKVDIPRNVVIPSDTSNGDVGGNTSGGVDASKNKENTRSTMALLFALGFFAILFLCFVYAIKVDASLLDLKDTLIAIIGSLSGILGFIVGYYYKSSIEK